MGWIQLAVLALTFALKIWDAISERNKAKREKKKAGIKEALDGINLEDRSTVTLALSRLRRLRG